MRTHRMCKQSVRRGVGCGLGRGARVQCAWRVYHLRRINTYRDHRISGHLYIKTGFYHTFLNVIELGLDHSENIEIMTGFYHTILIFIELGLDICVPEQALI